jgi:hypothetical protein
MGNVYLLGKDRDTWAKENVSDLVTFKSRGDEDLFSSWMMDCFIHWYHRVIGKHFKVRGAHSLHSPIYNLRYPLSNTYSSIIQKPQDVEHASNTVSYSNIKILRITLVIWLVLASLLPVGAIAVLYSVTSMSTRIGITGAFTAIFSLCLGLLTNTRILDIFAATAA